MLLCDSDTFCTSGVAEVGEERVSCEFWLFAARHAQRCAVAVGKLTASAGDCGVEYFCKFR